MRVPKKIRDEIKAYCEINNIENIDPFIVEQIVKGFNITKYGNAPFVQEVVVEKEVPIEKIKEIIVEKEVPVEIIKEVIKEIPVEKEVIKEIIVEKETYITDDTQVQELGEKIIKLEENITTQNQSINNKDSIIRKLEENVRIVKEEKDKTIEKVKESNGKNYKKDNKIKELNNKILELEKEIVSLRNKAPHPDGRPIREIYDEDGKGGCWGSNLKDKK